jgi:hypothetical protein
MELVNVYDEYFFDPTPKLKSSSVPIFFVSFNKNDDYCIRCDKKYSLTIICDQKYCKRCLSFYLTYITDNNMCLDVYLFTKECNGHELYRSKVSQNIQECCRNCLKILYFKQILTKSLNPAQLVDQLPNLQVIENCNLCGKLLYQGTDLDILSQFKLCSSCYLISSGSIESTLTKNIISIIHLPWWEDIVSCYCDSELTFTSDNQKYCESCFIFFIGCRYCLTTNIIFGITNQSECKKCKRISNIIFDITKTIGINSGNSVLDDFLISIRSQSYQSKMAICDAIVKNIDKYIIPSKIFFPFRGTGRLMKFIPYSQFTDVIKITEGGFSIVYQAIWYNSLEYDHLVEYCTRDRKNNYVILKRFKNLQYAEKYFISEVDTVLFRIYFI